MASKPATSTKASNSNLNGLLTNEFLDFSASRGNNLRDIGLKDGCKWCLCTSRWKEAYDHAKSKDDPVVPKVFLHATDESALGIVSLDDLKKFAAEGETNNGGAGTVAPITPSTDGKGAVRETH
ncbi:hypothetical protein MMC13_008289 [Lambiella insularis]|nr:hypothetical protein [Lambiella insularis]